MVGSRSGSGGQRMTETCPDKARIGMEKSIIQGGSFRTKPRVEKMSNPAVPLCQHNFSTGGQGSERTRPTNSQSNPPEWRRQDPNWRWHGTGPCACGAADPKFGVFGPVFFPVPATFPGHRLIHHLIGRCLPHSTSATGSSQNTPAPQHFINAQRAFCILY